MSAQLEALLRDRADAHWTVEWTGDGGRFTAATRETFSNEADAMVAAEDLLASVLDLGYRLRGGTVGARMPVDSQSEDPWRGCLVEVVLADEAPPG